MKLAEQEPESTILVGLSGRGDKDVSQAQALLGAGSDDGSQLQSVLGERAIGAAA
jgi:hypothetical protein